MNSSKVANLVKAYVDKYKHARKKWDAQCPSQIKLSCSKCNFLSLEWGSRTERPSLFLISLPFIEWRCFFFYRISYFARKKRKRNTQSEIVMQEPFILRRSCDFRERTVGKRLGDSGVQRVVNECWNKRKPLPRMPAGTTKLCHMTSWLHSLWIMSMFFFLLFF